ncbi:MAG: LLM class flavin-dependent oxidoreductase [Chloroflexi bacterium]|nr:LLM class flavin-dependent oxidoreductase [Chloroflexota bacterium]
MIKDRVALYLQDAHPLQDGIKYAQYAESKGFEAVWQAESRLVRDAIVPMAAFAATTARLKVGSGVINNWTRNIGLLAMTFLTLDDLAPNRIICGIGAWWDPLARNVGIERRKPLLAMRETIEVMRRLLRMGKLDDIDRPQLMVCSVHHDRRTAIDGAKELLTQYLAQQPHIAKASGVGEDVVKQIQSILGWPATKEQVHQAMQYVPDDLVLRISATGTPEEARARVREYVKRGCTCPILYPLGDPYLMIDAFAEGYGG